MHIDSPTWQVFDLLFRPHEEGWEAGLKRRKKGQKQTFFSFFLVPKVNVKACFSRTRGPISTLEVLDGVNFDRLSTHVFEVLIRLPPLKVIFELLSNIQKVTLLLILEIMNLKKGSLFEKNHLQTCSKSHRVPIPRPEVLVIKKGRYF